MNIPDATAPKKDLKILLIEDDQDDVLLTKECLSEINNYNFTIDWEASSEEAKLKVVKEDYDLCLIDYNLGRTTGVNLLKYMRGIGVLTPAIILTGLGDSTIDTDASDAGAYDFLTKSELSPSTLERSIRYATSQYKFIKELNEQEKKYRSLFEKSLDSIFLANLKLNLLDLNESFLQLFEYSMEEAKGLTIKEIFADAKDFEYCYEQLKTAEYIRDFEVELITKSRKRKICLLNCVFIPNQSSDFCCYQGIICDLTIRKKAESDMMIAERLSMTGTLARTIAHEVRNPLTNLNLSLENLKELIPSQDAEVIQYFEIIERNSNRIESLVSDLLKSSMPKDLQLEQVDINQVINETLILARDRINLADIELSTLFTEDIPQIFIDKEKIKLAILNIVINGIEAIDKEKGKLTISTSHDPFNLFISIQDNGKGIAASEINKLFDAFYTGKESGTGLGLTSTRNILSSHNAEIKVSSSPGEGTTFTLIFKWQQ